MSQMGEEMKAIIQGKIFSSTTSCHNNNDLLLEKMQIIKANLREKEGT